MNRTTYLNNPDVQDFIEWSANLVTGKWHLCTPFHSLYDAFNNYCWDGRNFKETTDLLDEYRMRLRRSTAPPDPPEFKKIASKVCNWGYVPLPRYLCDFDERKLQVIQENAELLNPNHGDTDKLKSFCMNAGFSKIYSLMIDDLPIYDSRVACALTSMIRLFCIDKSLGQVPDSLKLTVLTAKNKNRDPSDDCYKFHTPPKYNRYNYDQYAWALHRTRHAVSNLKAAWILGEWAEKEVAFPKKQRIRALESALFMLGDKPLKDDAIIQI